MAKPLPPCAAGESDCAANIACPLPHAPCRTRRQGALDLCFMRQGAQLPGIFYVNWFRKDADGKFLWPGYGENSRVLNWIFERVSGRGNAIETPIGYVPAPDAIDASGLQISADALQELLRVDPEEWKSELSGIREHFERFGDRTPPELWWELEAMEDRLEKA